jgi:TatD DNase family protein
MTRLLRQAQDKNAALKAVVRQVPLEKIVLETDSPYLPPQEHRGERNEPSYLPRIAAEVAALKDVPVEEVARVTSAAAAALFGLKG